MSLLLKWKEAVQECKTWCFGGHEDSNCGLLGCDTV